MRATITRLLVGGLLAAFTFTGAPGAPAVAGPPAAERAAASLRLVGNGYGHGHGLSQYGAQGAATQGLGVDAILRFYYPGLDRGTASGDVSVLLTGDTTSDVVVSARRGLKVMALGKRTTVSLDRPALSKARLWRITPADRGRRSVVSYRASRGGWKVSRTLTGDAQFTAGGAPITLHTPAGNRAYRGVIRSASPSASGSTARDTVNILPLESYLKGVVPREVPASWKPAAVQAQSVAARTYAAFERAQPLARHYQICDTSQCQVYGGFTDEHPDSNAAIDATARRVLTSGGEPAFTQFSASNGGWMSAGSQPYLVAKKDAYDQAYRGWTATVTGAAISRALPAIGTFRSAEVLTRDGNGQWGGRVLTIRLVGSRTSTVISGDTFRSYFGLRSNWFELR